MSIKKLDDGQYQVDIRPAGRNGKRIRKRFDKKMEAQAFERYVLANADKKEWLGATVDRRQLSTLLDTWWLYHGQNLRCGQTYLCQLKKTVSDLGDPAVNRFNKRSVLEYRARRLSLGITAATINRDLGRLSGVFSFLSKADLFTAEHPLRGIGKLEEKHPEMTYLTLREVARLLSMLEGEERRFTLFCLSTGARFGEANNLTAERVNHGRVTFMVTKSGKPRTVPISSVLQDEIKTRDTGRLFNVDYPKFRLKLKAIKPDLPKGQAAHVLRHTFASHFIMKGGNIIALQRILGHATIQQTMVYAHFSPEYLQDAVALNPLSGGLDVAI
ncbi:MULTISPECIES: phage integrase [Serratia]|uniref:Tyrosine-type recombinase/integrase n=1 Tax=Serratia proteamaculans TaxID=28151 RepID=A0A5Q2VGA2_SERPR|nr:tyrosine-type recombinase/integrase [Serratia proteamaculans]QGH62621.1 tyrosine-type recombinase/integrase [Serratia proteamaculans]